MSDVRKAGPLRVLLGVLVCWQLGHMLVANAVRFFRHDAGDPWGHVTGQYQFWWEFDHVPTSSPFPLVELRWDDPPRSERFHARSAPADPNDYAYGLDRARWLDSEGHLIRWISHWTPEKIRGSPDSFTAHLTAVIRDKHRPLLAYLRLREAELRGGRRPDAVVLIAQQYFTPPPPGQEPWRQPPPAETVLLRWRPAVAPPPGHLPLERCDPETGRFHFVAEEL